MQECGLYQVASFCQEIRPLKMLHIVNYMRKRMLKVSIWKNCKPSPTLIETVENELSQLHSLP